MNKLFQLPMRLQFFAEDTGGGDGGNNDGEQNPSGETKTFTQEELDQVVADRVSRESKKAAKAQKDLQAKLDAATAKLENAGKSEEEQENAELDALKGNLSAKEEELANTKAELEALKQGVDVEKIDKVIKLAKLSDEEDIEDAIKGVLEEFPMLKNSDSVNPTFAKDGNPAKKSGVVTKEQFEKMGYNERLALKQSNPTLYKQLK